MPTITIRYESDMFGATLQALVDYAVAAGEAVSATPGAAAAKPAAPPAKRHGRYGDGVAKGGGYGGRRDAEPPMDDDDDDDDDDDAEIICAYCWTNAHDPQYKSCFDCKDERDAEMVDCAECDGANRHAPEYERCYECAEARRAEYVDCRECGERQHAPKYQRCYECAQTRKQYAASADEAHTPGVTLDSRRTDASR